MKKSSTRILQIVVVLIGLGILAFMLIEPHLEGRNANATMFEIYFKDAFLAYAYTASIWFFAALYNMVKLLGYIGENKTFSLKSMKALRNIRYYATTLVAFIVGAEAYLIIVRPGDDIAGGVFMGLLGIAIAGVTAIVAKVFERTWQNAVDIKSENDLTV